jgi:hypothetical protein
LDATEEVIMSQCHDTYSWNTYHSARQAVAEGAQCHDPDDSPRPDAGVNAAGHADNEADNHELQPA